MAFRTGWKDAFSLHAGERRAVIVLILLCLVAAAWVTYEQWFRPTAMVDLAPYEAQLAQWQAQQDSAKAAVGRSYDVIPDSLFAFDPNDLPVETWISLGLSRKQAEALHRYEAAGGHFKVKSDVARMRVVRPDLYAAWEPFIQLPETSRREKHSYPEKPSYAAKERERATVTYPERKERAKVELNTADSASLVALNGIGPSFAKGIIGYRKRLGGYLDLRQLEEVYVLQDKPEAVLRIRELVVLDTLMVQRIDINACTVEELAAHPYAGWKVSKALIAYRQQHGPFADVEAIQGCKLIDPAVFRKLAPYLTTQ